MEGYDYQVITIISSDPGQTKQPVVYGCLCVSVSLRLLDSDASLHLLDYVRDLKPGLGHWAVEANV